MAGLVRSTTLSVICEIRAGGLGTPWRFVAFTTVRPLPHRYHSDDGRPTILSNGRLPRSYKYCGGSAIMLMYPLRWHGRAQLVLGSPPQTERVPRAQCLHVVGLGVDPPPPMLCFHPKGRIEGVNKDPAILQQSCPKQCPSALWGVLCEAFAAYLLTVRVPSTWSYWCAHQC